ncbi:hypothetical protein X971_2250 [Agrobacterium tumefaciens LBA4213 (Ach5)]|nr:hypothetical protein X971_2250 [Agrobacterium tumefaciens LBA4213 (Ach5)]
MTFRFRIKPDDARYSIDDIFGGAFVVDALTDDCPEAKTLLMDVAGAV